MPQSSLTANVVAFCRLLREHEFSVGPAEESDVMRALTLIRIGHREEFRLSLRAILASSQREQERFDALYAEYWGGRIKPGDSTKVLDAIQKGPTRLTLLSWGSDSESEEGKGRNAGYSPAEVLTRKNFDQYKDEDFVEGAKLIRAIARLLAAQITRRYSVSRRRRFVDFRRTMRQSLRHSGEVIDLAFRERRKRRTRIVVFCDVSGSMESYSRFFLSFIHTMQQAYGRIETFVFSTSLYRLTGVLKHKSLGETFKDLADVVPEWSGGTRIGASLQMFLDLYGHSLLSKDTVVLILSDGWDIGGIDVLEHSMKQIRLKANRILWLNPLLGDHSYEPGCAGMQAALPYVDEFLPVHNLQSLYDLYHHLTSTRRRKVFSPVRGDG